MLAIRKLKHLSRALDTSPERLEEVLQSADSYYEELLLLDPTRPDKRRTVIDVRGELRRFQTRLYRKVLLPKVTPSVHSHGGIRGRSIKTNAEPHLTSSFVFKADISNFYPSVHYKRVYRLFTEDFECSPDVARQCTRLCTYKHHLALGLVTSPILADQILKRVDVRIGGACQKAGLVYTRFVDDITISGPFDLGRSGFPALIERILCESGFQANPMKHVFSSVEEQVSVTNLRIADGHLDVKKEYADELERQLENAARLARGDTIDGPYFTPSQVLGRVRFVCWINPGRRRKLMRKYRSIRWELVRDRARQLGLEATKKSVAAVDRG